MQTRLRLSDHFVIEEFDCNDGTHVPKQAEQACRDMARLVLEPLREKYGPCTINSGYRHSSYNDRVGGARNSQHVYNNTPFSIACDVSFRHGNVDRWKKDGAKLLKKVFGGGGVGRYPRGNFVHFDSRRQVGLVTWEGP